VRQILFAREEAAEWPPLQRAVIANRALQDRIPSLDRVV